MATRSVIDHKIRAKLKFTKEYLLTHDFALAFTLALIFIALAIFFGFSNNKTVPLYPKPHFHYTLEPTKDLSFLSNWDGPDYLNIVKEGYHTLKMANFFPMYPLLVKLVNLVLPSLLYSALLVAWTSLVVAIFFYIKIVKLLFKVDQIDALKFLMFFLLFPSGIFLIATYSESLYSALALSALYAALKKKYLIAALLLMFCTATHITGMFVVVLVAMVLYEQGVKLARVALSALIGSLGLITYMLFDWRRFHSPIAFIKAQEQIHGWLHHGLLNIITGADILNVILVILLITSAVYWWKRRKSFAVYSLIFLTIPIAGRQYGGFNRYVLMAFPLQFMLGEYFKKRYDARIYMFILMAITWTYFTLQYAAGYIGS